MPELPEVDTIRRQLSNVIVGLKVKRVEIKRKSSFVGSSDRLVGKRVESVSRKAKMLIVTFEGNLNLLIHLKMTGQLVWRRAGWVMGEQEVAGGHPSEDMVAILPNNHTRVQLSFDDDSVLFFNDMRAFGWMKLLEKDELLKVLNGLPPDVIDSEFSVEYLGAMLRSDRSIKVVVMDNGKLGGVGNIYANDGLYLAGIDPRRKASSLDVEEVMKLHKSLIEVIERGIKNNGASFSNYLDSEGKGGGYQNYSLVYKKDGLLCQSCGSKIKKIVLGGRGTYCCDKCQK